MQGLIAGGFIHAPSAVEYAVFARDGSGWMSYHRPASSTRQKLSGERQLRLFAGSGHRGRTYLYEQNGLWFEAPINYYSKKEVWDMAPNFGATRTMPDGLPVDSNCLHCHASQIQPPVGSTRNRYLTAPFRQGGIGCVACHGDASAHVASQGRGPVLNPSKLSASRRDSVCLQCHLEGDAAIYSAGRSLASFKPGEELTGYVNYFVKAGAEAGGGRAASQYEALLRSQCKIASGDKLTCTTCHDPHSTPSESERVGFFRARCLTCHTGTAMATTHHPEQQDCAVCHMPTRKTTDISHEQSTDHQIRRNPSTPQLTLSGIGQPAYRLVPVGAVTPADREYGLAYVQPALRGNREALNQAMRYLQKAELAGASDAEFHAQFGLMQQLAGHLPLALAEYNQALQKEPANSTALANKAVIEAASGKASDALHLLEQVVADDPSQLSAGLNLAFIECVSGDKRRAREVLANLRLFSPDNPALNAFRNNGTYAGQHCAVADDPALPAAARP